MRARVWLSGVVLGGATLGGVCLSASSGVGAVADGLTSDSMLAGARFDRAFSGAADPDAPIATGRWGENQAVPETLVLAGGPPPEVQTLPLPPTAATLETRARAALPPPTVRQAAFQPRRQAAPASRLEIRTDAEAIPALPLAPPPSAGRPFDAKRILLRIGPAPQDRGKGRWFVFAAASGEAFGLNLIRDPVQGWRRGGWSVERLAEYGKAQIGVGWRRQNAQVALSVARREISAYGVSREDTVVGVSMTVSGKPPAKVRFEQNLPRR